VSNLCCLCEGERSFLASLESLLCLGVSLEDLLNHVSNFMQFKILDAPTSVHLILDNVWIALVSELDT